MVMSAIIALKPQFFLLITSGFLFLLYFYRVYRLNITETGYYGPQHRLTMLSSRKIIIAFFNQEQDVLVCFFGKFEIQEVEAIEWAVGDYNNLRLSIQAAFGARYHPNENLYFERLEEITFLENTRNHNTWINYNYNKKIISQTCEIKEAAKRYQKMLPITEDCAEASQNIGEIYDAAEKYEMTSKSEYEFLNHRSEKLKQLHVALEKGAAAIEKHS